MAERARRERVPTPDGRYLVVDGVLWRAANPHLPEPERAALVKELMDARRRVHLDRADPAFVKAARARVHAAKVALGERGPLWWNDAPDENRRKVENSSYAGWWAERAGRTEQPPRVAGR